MKKREYVCEVAEKGKLLFADRTVLPKFIEANFQIGDKVMLTVEEFKESKTLQQLRYWHGPVMDGVLQVFTDAGHQLNKPQARAYFEGQVLPFNKDEILIGFHSQQITINLRDLTKERMAQCIDFAIQWCAENGVQILSPEEYYKSIGVEW
jgi:hypothetical protein